jgi:AcrR family transcriptional regulator
MLAWRPSKAPQAAESRGAALRRYRFRGTNRHVPDRSARCALSGGCKWSPSTHRHAAQIGRDVGARQSGKGSTKHADAPRIKGQLLLAATYHIIGRRSNRNRAAPRARPPASLDAVQAIQSSGFRRARTDAQKAQRRAAILTAAEALAASKGVRTVTLGDIGARVGLSKSNVLQYFETREDIYLELTIQAWREWVQATRTKLDQLTPSPASVADALADGLSERPLLCQLLAYRDSNLEHNVSAETLHSLRNTATAAHLELAAAIARALPQVGRSAANDLINVTTMLAGTVWLRANPPPALSAVYNEDPNFPIPSLEFAATLRRVIHALIVGMTASEEGQRGLFHYQPFTQHPQTPAQQKDGTNIG